MGEGHPLGKHQARSVTGSLTPLGARLLDRAPFSVRRLQAEPSRSTHSGLCCRPLTGTAIRTNKRSGPRARCKVSDEVEPHTQKQHVAASSAASRNMSGSAAAGYRATARQPGHLPRRNAAACRTDSPCAISGSWGAGLFPRCGRCSSGGVGFGARFRLVFASRSRLACFADGAAGRAGLGKSVSAWQAQTKQSGDCGDYD